MFPTRRLKAESPYFSKILMRARPRAPPRANFRYSTPEKWKFEKIDFFGYQKFLACARANIFEKLNVSAFQRRVARVLTTSSYFFKRI